MDDNKSNLLFVLLSVKFECRQQEYYATCKINIVIISLIYQSLQHQLLSNIYTGILNIWKSYMTIVIQVVLEMRHVYTHMMTSEQIHSEI